MILMNSTLFIIPLGPSLCVSSTAPFVVATPLLTEDVIKAEKVPLEAGEVLCTLYVATL